MRAHGCHRQAQLQDAVGEEVVEGAMNTIFLAPRKGRIFLRTAQGPLRRKGNPRNWLFQKPAGFALHDTVRQGGFDGRELWKKKEGNDSWTSLEDGMGFIHHENVVGNVEDDESGHCQGNLDLGRHIGQTGGERGECTADMKLDGGDRGQCAGNCQNS